MGNWARDTVWRQGHIVPSRALIALGVEDSSDNSDTVAVVVSHDCDIAQSAEQESTLEIIVGKWVSVSDGNYSYAKNARRLHLLFSGDIADRVADLIATDKKKIDKRILADFLPDSSLNLKPEERNVLQRWLAARYRRSAFPDEFDRRLQATGIADRLRKILRGEGATISAIFFDVDDGHDIKRSGADEAYAVGIYLLYNTDNDPDLADKNANKVASAIRNLFSEKCFSKDDGRWQDLELVECEAIADRSMTIHQAEHLKRWSADYISLKPGMDHSILDQE